MSASAVARIRVGGPGDVPAVVALFDDVVVAMAADGARRQTQPVSGRAGAIARIVEWAAGGGLRLAEADGEVAGALVLGARPPYVGAAGEPEVYVEALVVAPRHRGRDVGGALLDRAAAEARERGAALLRTDCWGGAERLVAYYERHGFVHSGAYTLDGGWHGQVLSRRL